MNKSFSSVCISTYEFIKFILCVLQQQINKYVCISNHFGKEYIKIIYANTLFSGQNSSFPLFFSSVFRRVVYIKSLSQFNFNQSTHVMSFSAVSFPLRDPIRRLSRIDSLIEFSLRKHEDPGLTKFNCSAFKTHLRI